LSEVKLVNDTCTLPWNLNFIICFHPLCNVNHELGILWYPFNSTGLLLEQGFNSIEQAAAA